MSLLRSVVLAGLLLGLAVALVPSRHLRDTEKEGDPVSSNGGVGAVVVDVGRDSSEDNDVNKDVEVDDDDKDGFYFSFRRPSFADMMEGFRRLEAMFKTMQERMFNHTSQLPTTYDNSTEEIVEIGGRRYKLIRKVTHKGDNDSSVFFSATSLVPADRKKRAAPMRLD